MKPYIAIAGLTAIAVTAVLLAPGFATVLGGPFAGNANTYNQENMASMQYLTITLGETQYSGAVTSDVKCHTVIYVGEEGRTAKYVPDYTDTVTVSAVQYSVTNIAQFDVTVVPSAGSDITHYTLDIGVDDSSDMHGTFYLSYWTDPEDDETRVNIAFPTSGVSISNLPVGTLKICLYVNVGTDQPPYLNSLPSTPLDNVAFTFSTEEEVEP